MFESKENKENTVAMSKYMRNMFDFCGLPASKRKKVYNDFGKKDREKVRQFVANARSVLN